MAFIDLGDQFIALEAGRTQPPDGGRHIGLVVDDQEATVERAREAGAQMIGSHDFLDPWGNHWQVVDYREIQFSKTPRVLEGMGLGGLEKSDDALAELREKGLGGLELEVVAKEVVLRSQVVIDRTAFVLPLEGVVLLDEITFAAIRSQASPW